MVVEAAAPFELELEGRRAVWQVAPRLEADWARPEGVSHMVAHLLRRRGFDTPDKMAEFLNGPPPEHDPLLLPDMAKAVERIRAAAANHERVLVWGDFDADGLTATAVILEALQALGIETQTRIPTREDGHGIDPQHLSEFEGQGIKLLVTADTGIGEVRGVKRARDLGMDVIITDHHQPDSEAFPSEALLVCPTLPGSRYPFSRLAGSGVGYKLAQALLQSPEAYEPLLDLVVLGTVADVVPLVDENRTIVTRGLERLRTTPRAGLRALFRIAGVNPSTIDGSTIGFFLGPRINAANRMATPQSAFNLITATDPDVADRLANELDTLNAKRQDEVDGAIKQVIEETGPPLQVREEIRDGTRDPIICVLGKWGGGISGLLAGELTERYCVPAFAAAPKSNGTVGASGRSIRGVSVLAILHAAYDASSDAFAGRGGGHEAACGFTTTPDKIELAFKQLGTAARGRVPTDNLVPVISVDARVALHQMTKEAMETVESLEPYGQAFEAPLFLATRVCLSSRQRTGGDGKHLRMMAKSGNARVSAIIFNHDPEMAEIPEEQPLDIVFNLRRNERGGTFAPQLYIRDWRLSD